MTTARTIGSAIAAAELATAGQAAARDAVVNAATIAALSAGVTPPTTVPGVSVAPGASDGQGGA